MAAAPSKLIHLEAILWPPCPTQIQSFCRDHRHSHQTNAVTTQCDGGGKFRVTSLLVSHVYGIDSDKKAANKTYNTKKDKTIKVYGWNVASFCVAPSSKLFGNEEHTFHFLASRRVLQIGCSLPCQQTTRHWEPPTSQSDPGSFWPTGDVQRNVKTAESIRAAPQASSLSTLWSNCFPNSFRITLDWKRLQRTLWEQHLFLVLSLWVRHKH